jgi:glycosyltransferase involved in cell wall biosynthesis
MDIPEVYKKIYHHPCIEESGIKYPLVTVIVTNYNYSGYIVSCMESVRRQIYPNYKCIVIDDCSTDNSVDKIKGFLDHDSSRQNFSLIRHGKNRGQMAAFKTGLEAAEGAFIVFLDADDILFHGFLDTHVKYHLNSDIPVAFTSSNQLQIDENSQIIYCHHPQLDTHRKPKYIDYSAKFFGPWIWATTSSMMYRKSVLKVIMPADISALKICADAYIAKFANLLSGSLLIPTVHGCYRRHENNYFSNNPFIGGVHPTGDSRIHPEYKMIRDMIIAHIAANKEEFTALLTEATLIKIFIVLFDRFSEFHQFIEKNFNLYSTKSKSFMLKFKIIIFLSILSKNIRMAIKHIIKKPMDFFIKLVCYTE